MNRIRRHTALLLLILMFAVTLAAVAWADEKVLGVFDDWGAQSFTEAGMTTCTMWSAPTKDQGKYKKRGAIYAYVTHRPWDKRLYEVSVVAGYAFKKDSPVHVRIGGQKFDLFTDGDTAWSKSAKDDKKLVGAMKRGNSMVVTGISSRGTNTTDTYSLKGFTMAINAIGKACKVK